LVENRLEGKLNFISPPTQPLSLTLSLQRPYREPSSRPLAGAASLEYSSSVETATRNSSLSLSLSLSNFRTKLPLPLLAFSPVFPFPVPLYRRSVSSVQNRRPSLSLSLTPARSLTGCDRRSWRSASLLVVGHPPPAFRLRHIWRPDLSLATLKKVLSSDALSLSLFLSLCFPVELTFLFYGYNVSPCFWSRLGLENLPSRTMGSASLTVGSFSTQVFHLSFILYKFVRCAFYSHFTQMSNNAMIL
jgi:hypothetical protein